MQKTIYNHKTNKVSDLDLKMIKSVPPGGNWKNIPESIPSERLKQIRCTGGRTTYYGRLRYDMPSYTISTYFNRPGNGCYIHPNYGSNGKGAQHRLITFREAARMQSFPDAYRFYGSKTSKLKQIGNAVPPLLARAVASCIKEKTFVDLFSGAGGMSIGFEMTGKKLVGAIEYNKNMCETFRNNHNSHNDALVEGDITQKNKKNELLNKVRKNLKGNKLGIIIGGPPCQGFSLAGKRFIDDPRNTLFKEFVEIVKILKPKVFVMENVPGLHSMDKGRIITEIIKCFEKIGYIVNAPKILKAEEFGVPQRRRRLFVIGYIANTPVTFHPKQLFALEDSLPFPKSITVYEAISDLPPIYDGLGKDDWLIDNWKPKSEYQKLMGGLIDFKEFYGRINKNPQRVVQAGLRCATNSRTASCVHS